MSLDNIAQRPWLGYGFGAFWRPGEVEARTMWQMLHWIVPHAHNLWLEVGLGLGIVGMTGITLVWLAAFYRGIRVLTAPGARHAVFCLAMLTAILVENLTEYEFLKAGSLYWVLFVAAFTYLGREALAARAAARAAAGSRPARRRRSPRPRLSAEAPRSAPRRPPHRPASAGIRRRTARAGPAARRCACCGSRCC